MRINQNLTEENVSLQGHYLAQKSKAEKLTEEVASLKAAWAHKYGVEKGKNEELNKELARLRDEGEKRKAETRARYEAKAAGKGDETASDDTKGKGKSFVKGPGKGGGKPSTDDAKGAGKARWS